MPETVESVTRPMPHPAATGTRSFPSRQPEDPPPVWGNVPPRNPNFTGRGELLDQLAKRLTSGTTAVLPSAVHGLGGIGKTQMATEYIYRHLQDYDLVWWIDAAHTTQIRAGLTELARVLGVQGATEANIAVPAVLETPQTDRQGTEINLDGADEITEKRSDLPPPVEQAAALRAVTGMPAHEYLRLFDETVEEILDTASTPDYELSVAAWNVLFEELKTYDPAAHQISRVSISPELDPTLRDPINLPRAIRDINRYGLTKIDHSNSTFQLHRLAQERP
ncbi:hypothetical protein [Amycolatopsis sp. NPDC058986]|uniref:hypothetical protein n=1 Tax=unclassified Amycolatopsis TaxID=2618356 RepID=UPI00366FE9AD